MGGLAWMVAAAAAAVAASWAFNALVHLVWRPYAVTRRMAAQGVRGPAYRFFSGNLGEMRRLRAEAAGATLAVGDHNFVPLVQPYHRKWISLYGRSFLYWNGATPNVCVADVDVVRQVLSDRTGLYPKNLMNPHITRLLGRGLVLTDGDDWKRHRKVVHPAFNMDKLKMMTATMSDCARSMMSDWEAQLAKAPGGVEIEVSSRFEELTADVISHTAFGSSYKEGRQVFLGQRELQFLAFSTAFNVQIPAFRYLPTEKNLRIWKLDKQVRGMLMDIIESRLATKDTAGYRNDLLGLMLEACAPEHGGESPVLSMDEIIDECKTFFFAGHDTTSHLLTWASFLLSTHPDWQEKLREEVRRECGDQEPSGDMLNKLKLVNMFLLETLRLYGPVSMLQRKASSDLDLGGIRVPEGTILTIPIATIHRDKEVWGEDAGEFKPERFENGVTRAAKHPNALLSFSSGPRSCIGQNFAMIEAKAVVAMILQKFKLELSPKYVHAPMDVITLRPRHGLHMILKRLEALFCEKDALYIKRKKTEQYTLLLQKGPQEIRKLQPSPYCHPSRRSIPICSPDHAHKPHPSTIIPSNQRLSSRKEKNEPSSKNKTSRDHPRKRMPHRILSTGPRTRRRKISRSSSGEAPSNRTKSTDWSNTKRRQRRGALTSTKPIGAAPPSPPLPDPKHRRHGRRAEPLFSVGVAPSLPPLPDT